MSNSPEPGKEPAGGERPDEAQVAALVRRARDGDAGAFDALVRMFAASMFNLAYRMTNSREDADDLTQEVFVKLYRTIGQFRGESRFSTWLYALAANTCRSGLRRLRRIAGAETVRLDANEEEGRPRHSEAVDPGDGPVKGLERREILNAVEAAVAELPEEFRIVVVLRDLQGLSYEEMAEALDCSMGTIKSRLARGRIRVRDRLAERGMV